MERGTGTFEPPPAKRARAMSVSVGGGGGGGGVEVVASPTSQKLRKTFSMVIIMVRMRLRTSVPASTSQIGGMRYVDEAFRKCQELIASKIVEALQGYFESKLGQVESKLGQVESKLGTLQGQFEGFRHEVKRELARLCSGRRADQHTRVETNQEDASASGSNTNIRLCFLNSLKQPIYTDKNITSNDNAGIKVVMYDEDGNIITSGSLSRVKVEILVLRGDFSANCKGSWTEDEFDKHIVQGRSGQELMLHTARLTNGQVEISQIRFQEGSCRTPSRTFIVAARVCKSEKTNVRVQEAVMDPVTVLDRRNEANEKRHPPRLDDAVYRLEEIAKDGVYHKRLIGANIDKVEGFLKALNEDEDKLKGILRIEKKPNSWLKLIRHAKDCVLDRQELKRYESEEGNLALLFNYVHDLAGAEFHGDYVACEGFDSAQKALVNKWKGHAYNQLANIPFDHVMKGNVPVPISSSIVAAAGPSVLAVPTPEPTFPGNYTAAYQGTGAPENLPRDEHLTGSIHRISNCDPMVTVPGDLETHYYPDPGTPLVDQPQVFQPPVVSWCDQSPQIPMDFPYPFELPGMDSSMFQHTSGASTSAQFNFETGHHPEALQMASAAAPTGPMMAPAPASFADQEQGTSWPAFPGSGFGNNY